MADGPENSATFSGCGAYRYELLRTWDERRLRCCWIMLNPSTADATRDDPTIRRCVGFAKAWGFGGIAVVNLFALRATNPDALWAHAAPKGPRADFYLIKWVRQCPAVIAAWGAVGIGNERWARRHLEVRSCLESLHVAPLCLALTKDGHPRHPLYARGTLRPVPWRSDPGNMQAGRLRRNHLDRISQLAERRYTTRHV
jgi:hypothetical protein